MGAISGIIGAGDVLYTKIDRRQKQDAELQRVKEEAEEKIKQLRQDNELAVMIKNKLEVITTNLTNTADEIMSVFNKIRDKQEKITDLKEKLDTVKTDKEKTSIETEITHLNNDINRAQVNLNKGFTTVEEYKAEFSKAFAEPKTSFIGMDIYSAYKEFLKTLEVEQILALSYLLFANVILTSIISLIFVLYGDYLIIRFQLESKFPRLATVIKLRRKLQRYYLILNIS